MRDCCSVPGVKVCSPKRCGNPPSAVKLLLWKKSRGRRGTPAFGELHTRARTQASPPRPHRHLWLLTASERARVWLVGKRYRKATCKRCAVGLLESAFRVCEDPACHVRTSPPVFCSERCCVQSADAGVHACVFIAVRAVFEARQPAAEAASRPALGLGLSTRMHGLVGWVWRRLVFRVTCCTATGADLGGH